MADTTDIDQEPVVQAESSSRDLPDVLRQVLREIRSISYGDYGEEGKRVSIEHGGKTYELKRGDEGNFTMLITDENGDYVETVDISEDADVKYLEKLFDTPTKDEEIRKIKDNL